MRDLTLLSKLLAEEDIHVIHRNQQTAMFDVLNRELSLPIWKDMSKNVQELMTLHEVGHALWTPLEMMEKVKEQKKLDMREPSPGPGSYRLPGGLGTTGKGQPYPNSRGASMSGRNKFGSPFGQ